MEINKNYSRTSILIRTRNLKDAREFYRKIPGVGIADSADQLLCLEMPDGLHITYVAGGKENCDISFFSPLEAALWRQITRTKSPNIQWAETYLSLTDPCGVQMVFFVANP